MDLTKIKKQSKWLLNFNFIFIVIIAIWLILTIIFISWSKETIQENTSDIYKLNNQITKQEELIINSCFMCQQAKQELQTLYTQKKDYMWSFMLE